MHISVSRESVKFSMKQYTSMSCSTRKEHQVDGTTWNRARIGSVNMVPSEQVVSPVPDRNVSGMHMLTDLASGIRDELQQV